MAKTCAVDFSYPTSYSTSILLWGSIGTPSALSNVSTAGLGKFRAKPTKCRFCVCSYIWSPVTEKVEHPEKQFSAVW